ncbi:MAG: glutathione S-transferase N-terminal domain-containing protein [Bdellovibrionales bacterium]|nr:glutathione S-transferase N-terminal domain-containing protein [Bdellovibrionales bacterium]
MANSNKFALYMSLRSPFARRVRLALTHAGIDYEEKIEDVFNPTAEFIAANPLGLVPTLVGPDGLVVSDSAMILEWIQARTGTVFPRGGLEWPVRQASVLCGGVITSVVLYFQEEHMHANPSTYWMGEHMSALTAALREIETLNRDLLINSGEAGPRALTQAGWDLATALEYMSLRLPRYRWSTLHPNFNAVMSIARADAKFAATVPPALPA